MQDENQREIEEEQAYYKMNDKSEWSFHLVSRWKEAKMEREGGGKKTLRFTWNQAAKVHS